MIRALVLLLSVGLSGACKRADPAGARDRVDTTLVRRVDVDGDGRPDEVRLRLVAPRFDAPFATELSIHSNGRTLYARADTTAVGDADFADSSFTAPCVGYARCKRAWYFEEYLTGVVQPADRLGSGVYDRAAGNAIYSLAPAHLAAHCGASPAAAAAAVDSAVARMRAGRAVVVMDLATAAHFGDPLVWVPEFGCFAPVYIE